MTEHNWAGGPNLNKHVLAALTRCHHLRHLKQLQAFLLSLGHGHTHFYAFKLVRFCALTLSDLPYARLLFDHLPSPNVYLYTALITAYASHNRPASVFALFNQLLRQRRPVPNHFILPHVLKSCSHGSEVGSVHAHAIRFGFGRHHVVQTALVDSYAKCSEIGAARKVFDGMLERNVVSWTAMLCGYARLGLVGNAVALFEEMPDRDVPSWNAVISGCTQNGMFSEAVSLFGRMVLEGVRPNHVTVVCALSASAHLGMLRLGRWTHGYIYKHDIDQTSYVTNAVLDMYGKCGSLLEASRVFDQIPDKCLTSWNSMINCLALHGQSRQAISFYERMVCEGVVPDEVTFVGLLNACTHAGLVDECCHYFDMMKHEYEIAPRIEHYGCMIDLLARVGRFEQAMEAIRGMEMDPDEVVWGSLLNGSRIHGKTELAEYAVHKLIEMDPQNAGYGVMLANVYSERGNWEDVGKTRKMLKQSGGQKVPGCSWIEVDDKVHQFYSSDMGHKRGQEIYSVVDGLIGLSRRDDLSQIFHGQFDYEWFQC